MTIAIFTQYRSRDAIDDNYPIVPVRIVSENVFSVREEPAWGDNPPRTRIFSIAGYREDVNESAEIVMSRLGLGKAT